MANRDDLDRVAQRVDHLAECRGCLHTTNEETTTAQITTSISTDMWVQFGLRYKLSSGTFGQADVATATCVRRS